MDSEITKKEAEVSVEASNSKGVKQLSPMSECYPKKEKRKLILALSKKDYDDLHASDKKEAEDILSNESLYILCLPLSPTLAAKKELQGLISSSNLIPGTLLVQNPFSPDEYEAGDVATDNISLAKHLHFTEVCMYLGAKSVRVVENNEDNKESQAEVEGEATYAGAGGKGKVEKKLTTRSSAAISLEDRYADDSEPDFLKAKEILQKTQLWWTDRALQNLYRMKEQGRDRLKSRRLVVNLAQEVTRNLSVSAEISSLPKILPKLASASLSVITKEFQHKKKDYIFEVIF